VTDASGWFEFTNAVEGAQYSAIVTLNDFPITVGQITLTGGASTIVETPTQSNTPAPAECETQSIVDRITRIAQLALIMRDRVLTELQMLSETAEISSGVSTLTMRARVQEQANNVLYLLTRLPTVQRQCAETALQCSPRSFTFEKRSLVLAFRALRTELRLINRVLTERGLRSPDDASSRAWAVRRANRARQHVAQLPEQSDVCS
jgi:hypothetical protein